ncbi:hypothetical protein H1R20_g12731, partial [Candolleomyces eurysporus]
MAPQGRRRPAKPDRYNACEDFEEAVQAIRSEPSSDDDSVVLAPTPSTRPQPRIQRAGAYNSLRRPVQSPEHTDNGQSRSFITPGQAPAGGAGLRQVPDLGALTTQIQKSIEVRYEQIVKDNQLEIGELKEQLRKLTLENTQMQNRMRQAGVRKKKNTQELEVSPIEAEESMSNRPAGSSNPSTGDVKRDEAIRHCARKFTVTTNLFPQHNWFMVPLSENAAVDITRYDNAGSKLAANVHELYEEVPPSLHDSLLKTTGFRKVFLAARNALVRQMTFGLRDGAGAAAFPVNDDGPVDWLKWSQPQRVIPGFSQEEMAFIFPVLFPGGIHNITLIFRNIGIARILHSLLFGSGSVKPKYLFADKWPVHGKCFAKLQGVKELTPAMIALGSVLAVFWNSGDESFADVGASSKINYCGAFEFYKEFIIRTYHNGSLSAEWMDDLLQWYHDNVFPSQTTKARTACTAEEQNQAMQMSQLMTELERELRAGAHVPHPPAPNSTIPAEPAPSSPLSDEPAIHNEPTEEHPQVLATTPRFFSCLLG